MQTKIPHLGRVLLKAPFETLWIECLFILLFSLFIYLANGHFISSDDSVPNSLLAFNWLENQTFHFDAFRQGHYYMPNNLFGANGIPYFFIESPTGHLASAYPIGTSIVSFPLYCCFWLYLKLTTLLSAGSAAIDITTPEFELQRQFFEKLAGTILTVLANVIFYCLARLKFSQVVSLLVTFVYGFATLNWVVSSQGLWVHTIGNLLLVSLLLCLFKANRTQGKQQAILLLVAGALCGLFLATRPTGLLFLLLTGCYVVWVYRQKAVYFAIGTLSFLPHVIWNSYYFGFSFKSILAGGYSTLLKHSGSYHFTWDYFKEAFLGFLVSPSRGILIFSPVLLFTIPGAYRIWKRRTQPDELLLIFLSFACLILFLQYCFFMPWWGAITYGSRFLVDFLPILCYPLGYFLEYQFEVVRQRRVQVYRSIVAVFLALTLVSTFTEVVGAFSTPHIWDTSPYFSPERLWDWQDNQISRHAKNLWFKLHPPISNPKAYLRRFKGSIESVSDAVGQPVKAGFTVPTAVQQALQVKLKNTGKSPWFGSDTGVVEGQTIVKVTFLDADDQPVKVLSRNWLYTKGITRKGETAIAQGIIWTPQQPGTYKMSLQLEVNRVFPKRRLEPYQVEVFVTPSTQ
ncbi:MAG TPA: hypothetical protein V6D10_24325 [Trichocoleus sp.]|jgi:hypothetical protein